MTFARRSATMAGMQARSSVTRVARPTKRQPRRGSTAATRARLAQEATMPRQRVIIESAVARDLFGDDHYVGRDVATAIVRESAVSLRDAIGKALASAEGPLALLDLPDRIDREAGRHWDLHHIVHVLNAMQRAEVLSFRRTRNEGPGHGGAGGKDSLDHIQLTRQGRARYATAGGKDDSLTPVEAVEETIERNLHRDPDFYEADVVADVPVAPFPLLAALRAGLAATEAARAKVARLIEMAGELEDLDTEAAEGLLRRAGELDASAVPLTDLEAEYLAFATDCEARNA